MNLRQYDAFCKKLPATTTVIQWGEAHVWKVGSKVFAIGREDDGDITVSFKVSDLAFEILSEQSGCRPAHYLASRGLKWIQRYGDDSVDDAALKDYLRESHRLAALNLTKRVRTELGLGHSRAGRKKGKLTP
jgi:predicted DNA-binding protein (MmcQ/YjbR family)